MTSNIDIFLSGDHSQGKFREICRLIMIDENSINMNEYIIKLLILIVRTILSEFDAQSSNKGGELYANNIFSNVAHMFF